MVEPELENFGGASVVYSLDRLLYLALSLILDAAIL